MIRGLPATLVTVYILVHTGLAENSDHTFVLEGRKRVYINNKVAG